MTQPLNKADCHCHTLFSDGSLSVPLLLRLAKEKNLSGLSITDHDTVEAYPTALPLSRSMGLQLISGIEISAEHKSSSIHVLGYAFDLNNIYLTQFCQTLQQARENRNTQILDRLKALKMPLTLCEIRSQFPEGTLGRPHIAKLMVDKGYVKSVRQAFTRYLGDKARCYVSGMQVNVETAIELIHRAGGYAILAHPHYIHPTRIIPELLTMPFDGIEVHYGHLSPKQEQPWLEIALKKNWLITGGSDFHGEKKAYHTLGCSWTPTETFKAFSDRFEKFL